MGYATSPEKVDAGRRRLDSIQEAVAQGRALDFATPPGVSVNAYAFAMRELLASAAEYPQAEGHRLLAAAVRVRCLHAERAVRVEPKLTAPSGGAPVASMPKATHDTTSKLSAEAAVGLLLNATAPVEVELRSDDDADDFMRGASALGWEVEELGSRRILALPPTAADDGSPFDLMEEV